MSRDKPKSRSARQPEPVDKPATTDPLAAIKAAGRVKFDERGNAVWEWAITTGAFGSEAATARMKKLDVPSLSIADDAHAAGDAVKSNPLGTLKGYNPYDSGKLDKTGKSKKTDLRKLSEWLKLRKQASNNKPDDDT